MPPKPPDNVVRFRRPKGPGISWRIPGFPRWLFGTVTGWLIVANVALWIGMVIVSLGSGIVSTFPGGLLLALGEMVPELVPTQPWRLVCAMFLHASILHIAFNMLFLGYFGLRLEEALGKGRYLVLYLLAGLGGEIGSYAWHFVWPGNSVGASGAIMGVMGGLTGLTWTGLGRNHPVTKMYLQYALVGFAIGIVESLMGVEALDNAAHIAGWLSGLGLGFAFAGRRPWPVAASRAALGAGALLVAGSFAATLTLGGPVELVPRSDGDARPDWEAAFQNGDWPTADTGLAAAIRKNPSSIALRMNHAQALDKLGRPEDAKAELIAAMKGDGSADAFAALAQMLDAHGEVDLARKAAESAKIREPGNPRYDRLYQDLKAKASGSAPATASPAAGP